MQTFQVITTVDITNPCVTRSCTDRLLMGQQSNFNTLVQTINLRSNIEWQKNPVKHTGGMPWPAHGRATHWIWEFTTERTDVFATADSPAGLLLKDLNNVPIVDNLENSTFFHIPVFKPFENVWITQIT